MKNKGLLLFLVLLGLVLGALPALAGTVSLTEDLSFSVSVSPCAISLPGQLSAFANGSAFYPAEEPASVYKTGLLSVTAALPSQTFLDTTKAKTSFNLFNQQFKLEQNQVGNAPGGFGFLYQATSNGFNLYITAMSAGLYNVTVADVYNLNYQLANNATTPGFFYDLFANTDVTATLTSVKNPSNFTGVGPTSIFSDSRFETDTPGQPLPDRLVDFAISQTGVKASDIVLSLQLGCFETAELSVSLDSNYFGDTAGGPDTLPAPVPLPPTLLLFGGGLGGLLLARRRFIRA